MPNNIAPSALIDTNRVNLAETYEVEYWTQRLNCSRDELRNAVEAVGEEVTQVAEFLQTKTTSLPITKIHLENFRSFRSLDIGPFKRVNLIAGLNNAGKTGLLEAIFLALRRDGGEERTNPAQLPHLFRVFSNQSDLNQNFWPWLFRDKKSADDIRIVLSNAQGGEEVVVISEPPRVQHQRHIGLSHVAHLGPYQVRRTNQGPHTWPNPAVFASHPSDPVQDAIDYNRVILKRGKKKVEDLLRQIDPRLQAIEALQTGQRPLIYADIGLPEMIPVAHLGEGFCRLLDIFSELLAGEARVLLIDEIENGLHHSVMPVVWKGLLAAARELDVQIFATTHSAECIFAADQAARETKPYDLNLIRLDRVDGEVKATMVDEDAMETAKKSAWELR